MTLLRVRDLHVAFASDRGMVRAVQGISFDLDEGEVLGVVGESGSGKSVAALSIMRMIPQPRDASRRPNSRWMARICWV